MTPFEPCFKGVRIKRIFHEFKLHKAKNLSMFKNQYEVGKINWFSPKHETIIPYRLQAVLAYC